MLPGLFTYRTHAGAGLFGNAPAEQSGDIARGMMQPILTGRVRDRDLFYRSYVQTYLQRDVRVKGSVGR